MGRYYPGAANLLGKFSNARRDWDDFSNILLQPRALDQLWYLFALFNVSMLYLGLSKLLQRHMWVHIAVALGLHYLSFSLYDYSLFSDFFYFYLFFLAGALISDVLLNAEARARLFKTSHLIWILPLFFLGNGFGIPGRTVVLDQQGTRAANNGQTGLIELLFILINLIGCYVLLKRPWWCLKRGATNGWRILAGTRCMCTSCMCRWLPLSVRSYARRILMWIRGCSLQYVLSVASLFRSARHYVSQVRHRTLVYTAKEE
jgi:hypothetical protein